MSERDRKFMRAQLASIGIILPDEQEANKAPEPTKAAPVSEVDRDEIRAILVELGAPERDLEWLVASCPGLEYALGYVPSLPEAWCVVCDGPRPVHRSGCVVCRAIPETKS